MKPAPVRRVPCKISPKIQTYNRSAPAAFMCDAIRWKVTSPTYVRSPLGLHAYKSRHCHSAPKHISLGEAPPSRLQDADIITLLVDSRLAISALPLRILGNIVIHLVCSESLPPPLISGRTKEVVIKAIALRRRRVQTHDGPITKAAYGVTFDGRMSATSDEWSTAAREIHCTMHVCIQVTWSYCRIY